MALILKQATAVDVVIGPFLDLTDAATSEESESPVVELSKNGQAFAAKSDATTPTHDEGGYYNCEFDATDTGTVGTLVLMVEKSATALPVRHEFQVVEEAVYDAFFGASAGMAVTLAAGAVTAAAVATGAIDADALAADAVAEIADAVWDEDASGHQTQRSFGQTVGDSVADASSIHAYASANFVHLDTTVVPTVGAILADTAEIGAAGAGLTNINLPNQTMDIVGNITGNLSGSVGSVTGAVGSVTGLTASDVGAIKAKTDSLTFTVAGQVDSNVQYVNDVEVTGDGQTGTEWGS